MKIHKQEATFQPITIVLESQEELDCLVIALNHNYATFEEAAENLCSVKLSSSQVKAAREQYGVIWSKLAELYDQE